jgi:hypothetical protein
VYSIVTGTVVYSIVTGTVVYSVVTGTVVYSVVTGTVVYSIVTGTVVYSVVTGTGVYSVVTGTVRTVDQKCLESFELWCLRRIEKISWTDRVWNEEVLHRVKEDRTVVHNSIKHTFTV